MLLDVPALGPVALDSAHLARATCKRATSTDIVVARFELARLELAHFELEAHPSQVRGRSRPTERSHAALVSWPPESFPVRKRRVTALGHPAEPLFRTTKNLPHATQTTRRHHGTHRGAARSSR